MNVIPAVQRQQDIIIFFTVVKDFNIVIVRGICNGNLRMPFFYVLPDLIVDRAVSRFHNHQRFTVQIGNGNTVLFGQPMLFRHGEAKPAVP